MNKSTFTFGIVIIAWFAYSFGLTTANTASQIILIMFILFSLIQTGIIKER